MSKIGNYFMYNNKTSLDWDLIMCDFDSDDSTPLGLQRTIDKGSVNKYKLVSNHYGTSYSDVLEFQIHVMKNPKNKSLQSDFKFSRTELREINAWLSSNTIPQYLLISDIDGDEDEHIEYCGLFTNIDTFMCGDLYGLKLTFTCNCPFGFSELKTFTYACAGNTTINIGNDSDEVNNYIYPTVIIEPKVAETISITNITDNSNISMKFKVLKNSPITVDCNLLRVTDSIGLVSLEDVLDSDIDDMYWLRLVTGRNQVQVQGTCVLTLKYREYRKVGAY